MSIESTVHPGTPIIDETNWRDHVVPPSADGCSQSGYMPRDYDAQPFGSVAAGVPQSLMIPRDQWVDRIREKAAKKETLSDLVRGSTSRGWRWLNQAGTNYCWCYAVVHGMMVVWLKMGGNVIRFSPASAAAPIKNYRNNGGWGTQALEYIQRNGIATEQFWPQNAISPRYFDSSRENAALHKIVEGFEIRPRNWEEKISLLLHDIPVPSGYSWMGHEMCSITAVILPNGRVGCEDLDSYAASNGTPNFKVLSESQGTPDDACALYTTTNY